jgi:hypothetical protein
MAGMFGAGWREMDVRTIGYLLSGIRIRNRSFSTLSNILKLQRFEETLRLLTQSVIFFQEAPFLTIRDSRRNVWPVGHLVGWVALQASISVHPIRYRLAVITKTKRKKAGASCPAFFPPRPFENFVSTMYRLFFG